MKKQQSIKKNTIAVIAVLGVIGVIPSVTSAMGPGSGNGGGMRQNMMNEDGVPIGLQDDDGDGIVNRDDEDFEKPMLNARDNDDDGVPNKIDEDYVQTKDGIGRPETAGQKAGQANSNRPEGVGSNGQMGQNTSPAQQRMNAPAGTQSEQATKNQVRQNVRNRAMDESVGNMQMRTQLRAMTQTREQMQQEVANDVVQLKKQSRLSKLFIGADSEVVEHAQNQLDTYEQKIDALKQLSESAITPEDKSTIDAQIAQMETMHNQMEELVEQNSDGFSLFGWMKNIFN